MIENCPSIVSEPIGKHLVVGPSDSSDGSGVVGEVLTGSGEIYWVHHCVGHVPLI